jgi:NAD-dependent dihydropyrimidine dehydrogenase PreA subunit
MAYVVADPCIGTKDRACVEVCPVSCFYENEDQLFIHPQECIDCDACVPVCPVTAIFAEAQVPEQWKSYIQKAVDYFAENTGVPAAKSKAEVGSGGVAEGSTHWKWKGQPAAAPKAAAAPPAPATTVEAAQAAVVESAAPATAPVHAAVAAATEAPVAPAPTAAATAPAAPAPPKPAVPPAAKPAPKPAPAIVPMSTDEFKRIEALLYQVLEMIGGSRPFDMAVFEEAEATGVRLKKEVGIEFGKETYTASELEKKGMALRQKQDLAQSLLRAVERIQFIPQFRSRRRKLIQTAVGGAVTAGVSVLCGILSLLTIRIDTLVTDANPGVSGLLQAIFNAESLIPFLAFQTIAGLLGLFALAALYQCFQLGKQLHELKRAMQAKHIDPRMIARLA